MADLLLNDMRRHLRSYAAQPQLHHAGGAPGFSHGASQEEKPLARQVHRQPTQAAQAGQAPQSVPPPADHALKSP
jgi:hypothetical protein